MFTGIVEVMGTVVSVVEEGSAKRLTIREQSLVRSVAIGDSVALNGCCLTVIEKNAENVSFQAGEETLEKTNLTWLCTSDQVNLECAVKAGAPLGGHFVQGHVDGVGRILSQEKQEQWETLWIEVPIELSRQMVEKGSITVDGVSLTIVDIEEGAFSVALIPHTLQVTNLGIRSLGQEVNIELDILGKYVRRYLEGLQILP
jgi:riboflavin synthase|tara:strand:- start:1055 stop:1657 length:603 start_codon:yes stop_codon:yes gene_type:complete